MNAYKIFSLIKDGNFDLAEKTILFMLNKNFPDINFSTIVLTPSAYSVNSVNGTVRIDGKVCWFKFHTEESEENFNSKLGGSIEYYNAKILFDAGYPIIMPILTSSASGDQITIYEYIEDENFAEYLRKFELSKMDDQTFDLIVDAQNTFDTISKNITLKTLKHLRPSSNETIFQLFYDRLVDLEGNFPGSRVEDFYLKNKNLNNLWDNKWVINDKEYPLTLREIWQKSSVVLDPSNQSGPIACFHGDDHNANIIIQENNNAYNLRLIDPAFASDKIPVLLGAIKSTCHNIFIHPNFIYHPDEYVGNCSLNEVDDKNIASTDWQLSPIRKKLLDSKIDNFWIPVIEKLKQDETLQDNWKEYISLALACCPSLFTNLIANERSENSRIQGLIITVLLGNAHMVENGLMERLFGRF